MSKVIQSTVRRYPGTVTLSYPLTYPQYATWRKAIDALPDRTATVGKVAANDETVTTLLPGICACVESWDLGSLGQLTPETFPATPRTASWRLLVWLIDEINKIVAEEEESPLS